MLTLGPKFESAARPEFGMPDWLFWWVLLLLLSANDEHRHEAQRKRRTANCAPQPLRRGPRPPAP